MSDGRKTRGKIGQKNEKAKLDKEWHQVLKGGGGWEAGTISNKFKVKLPSCGNQGILYLILILFEYSRSQL